MRIQLSPRYSTSIAVVLVLAFAFAFAIACSGGSSESISFDGAPGNSGERGNPGAPGSPGNTGLWSGGFDDRSDLDAYGIGSSGYGMTEEQYEKAVVQGLIRRDSATSCSSHVGC